MILLTHGLVGGALASVVPDNMPALFVLSFTSHLVLDMIPHWQYDVPDIDKTKGITGLRLRTQGVSRSIVYVAIDGGLGVVAPLAVALCAGTVPLHMVLIGALAGILPDFLQFVYIKTHTRLLYHYMQVHVILNKVHFAPDSLMGFLSQALIWVTAVVYMLYF